MSMAHGFTEYVDKPKQQKPQLPPIFSAKQLGAVIFPPVAWVVPEILPEGCTILAGRPKLGKSWMALDIALAVARGDYCLGDRLCSQGDVLYLALEDNGRRLQDRVNKVTTSGAERWPERLQFATQWTKADAGGVDAIRTWALSKQDPRLVVIDVLAHFRPTRGGNEDGYSTDYASVKALQELAGDLNIAILVVHHVRKSIGEVDPFEKISGTLGLVGGADSAIVLDRDGNGCSLYGRGRDMTEYTKAITFSKEDCRWTLQGDASEVRRTDERGFILSALLEATDPLTPSDLAAITGMTGNNVKQLCFKMSVAGEVAKIRKGLYVHPDRISEFRRDPDDSGE